MPQGPVGVVSMTAAATIGGGAGAEDPDAARAGRVRGTGERGGAVGGGSGGGTPSGCAGAVLTCVPGLAEGGPVARDGA